MAMVSLQLHLSLTPSPLVFRHVPRPSLDLKLLAHVPRPVFSSTNKAVTATEPSGTDVLLNGTPPANNCAEAYSVALPAGLRRELMPRHVAVIMDGNRRWARMKGLPVGLGYEAGVRSLRRIVELCGKWGISVLTVFAFSSDNWFRPKEGATSLSVLRSVWQSYWLHLNWNKSDDDVYKQLEQSLIELNDRFDDFWVQLEEAGWDTNQINLKVPKEISIQEHRTV